MKIFEEFSVLELAKKIKESNLQVWLTINFSGTTKSLNGATKNNNDSFVFMYSKRSNTSIHDLTAISYRHDAIDLPVITELISCISDFLEETPICTYSVGNLFIVEWCPKENFNDWHKEISENITNKHISNIKYLKDIEVE
jgi:hypothetical protein